MSEITPALAMSAYLLGRRIAGQRRKPEGIAINVLAATFDATTAEAVLGESGTLSGSEHCRPEES